MIFVVIIFKICHLIAIGFKRFSQIRILEKCEEISQRMHECFFSTALEFLSFPVPKPSPIPKSQSQRRANRTDVHRNSTGFGSGNYGWGLAIGFWNWTGRARNASSVGRCSVRWQQQLERLVRFPYFSFQKFLNSNLTRPPSSWSKGRVLQFVFL